jgi:2-amino-4-hydroxy-6-hydroxymethyldihydropteridine diphosphokinase
MAMRIAYIGMGANIASRAGAPEATLAAAVGRLASLGRVTRRSGLYSTTPVGYAAQPRFTNAAVVLETALAPFELLEALMAIEREFGRDRSTGEANGPRTLDLDILLIGDLVLHEAHLEVPHPRLAERAFVLVPLAEIAPGVVDPRHGKTVAQLLDTLRQYERSDNDGVVRIESESWRAAADGGSGVVRGSGEPDAHG